MKYKTLGAAAVVLAIICAIWFSDLSAQASKKNTRVVQHVSAAVTADAVPERDVLCSHLPLLRIDTDGVDIPGVPSDVRDKRGQYVYTTAEDGSATIPAKLAVIDHENTYNCITDDPTLTTDIRIRVRGYSSRRFLKKNYFIRLTEADDSNNPQNLLGMGAHCEWALHGPFLDQTLIRNYLCYNLAGEIMDYAPNVRFCELVLNGEYKGLYVLTETVTAGFDDSRLQLTVKKRQNRFSGYLLRYDRGSSHEILNLNSFSRYSLRAPTQLEIVYPGIKNITPEMQESIRQDFSSFEKALYSYDYDKAKYGYKNYLDSESFADYFIINELTSNYDAGRTSTYIYKEKTGKFKICVWDFNNCCSNYEEIPTDPYHFELQRRAIFYMLMKDEDFVETIISRYRELRKSCLSEESLLKDIDSITGYLGPAIDRNFSVWGFTFSDSFPLLDPPDRDNHSYEEAVAQLKNYLIVRGRWMDDNIESLRQYSAESAVKKYNEDAN